MIIRTIVFGLCTAAAATLCVRLGFWQLERLEQRRGNNAIVRERGATPPVSISMLKDKDTTEIHWRRVTLTGVAEYEREAVHAARSQGGSPGVHLLTPVRPIDGEWGDTAVLVLRGYVYSPDGRTVDPVKTREGDTLRLEAMVTSFTQSGPGTVRLPSNDRAVRTLERDTLAAIVGRPLAPFLLLALGDTVIRDVSLPARIRPPSLSEGNHLSYAFQWFAFAIVFVGGFVAYLFTFVRKRPAAS
jgi:surfeit locus 1 family protein